MVCFMKYMVHKDKDPTHVMVPGIRIVLEPARRIYVSRGQNSL